MEKEYVKCNLTNHPLAVVPEHTGFLKCESDCHSVTAEAMDMPKILIVVNTRSGSNNGNSAILKIHETVVPYLVSFGYLVTVVDIMKHCTERAGKTSDSLIYPKASCIISVDLIQPRRC